MSDYSEKVRKTHVAYLVEGWRESLAKDFGTGAMFVGLWSLGHFADSAALEWAGVIIGFCFVAGRSLSALRGAMDKRMTPSEARKWLDNKFPESSQHD